jgi:hypothetical protein
VPSGEVTTSALTSAFSVVSMTVCSLTSGFFSGTSSLAASANGSGSAALGDSAFYSLESSLISSYA